MTNKKSATAKPGGGTRRLRRHYDPAEPLVQLPPRRAGGPWDERYREIDSMPVGEDRLPAIFQLTQDLHDHPDTAAADCIEAALAAAHLDERVRKSDELSRFVFLMRELLQEHQPGETLEDLLQPLAVLMQRTMAPGGRQAVQNENRRRVRDAYGQLMLAQRGSGATALIANKTGLSKDTVREHLKEIRGKSK